MIFKCLANIPHRPCLLSVGGYLFCLWEITHGSKKSTQQMALFHNHIILSTAIMTKINFIIIDSLRFWMQLARALLDYP